MKFFGVILILLSFVFVCVSLLNIRKEQHSSHLIQTTIAGKVVGEYWVTNPVYYISYAGWEATSNGVHTVIKYHTNYYWHVWSIFK